jgi:hypothetical protein
MCNIEIVVTPYQALAEENMSDKDVQELILICVFSALQKINYGYRKFFAPIIEIGRTADSSLNLVKVTMTGTHITEAETIPVMEVFQEGIFQSSLAGPVLWEFNKSVRNHFP